MIEDEPTEPEHELPRPRSLPLSDDDDDFDGSGVNVGTEFWGSGGKLYRNNHPKLNGIVYFSPGPIVHDLLVSISARPCDALGQFLEDGASPALPPSKSPDDWTPYRNRVEFETAEFLYTRNQMSAGDINALLDLWAATLLKHGDKPPFADCRDLYKTIDSTPVGDVKWKSFPVRYTGEKPECDIPSWMDQSYDVWYRDPHEVVHNMLANPNYANEMDYSPYREYATDGDERQWKDFMSSDWAWKQAVRFLNHMVVFACMLIIITRISYLRILKLLARRLCQLYLVVTRLRFQSQLAQMITIHCMHQSGVSVTMSDVHIVTLLPSSGSSLCQKVNLMSLPLFCANSIEKL